MLQSATFTKLRLEIFFLVIAVSQKAESHATLISLRTRPHAYLGNEWEIITSRLPIMATLSYNIVTGACSKIAFKQDASPAHLMRAGELGVKRQSVFQGCPPC